MQDVLQVIGGDLVVFVIVALASLAGYMLGHRDGARDERWEARKRAARAFERRAG